MLRILCGLKHHVGLYLSKTTCALPDPWICYVMLRYVMLCYVMLCYVMLCYVMLCIWYVHYVYAVADNMA